MTRIERYKKDIKSLEEAYGEFKPHSELTIDLLELSEICPRKYNQIKSYRGLLAFLARTKGINITITSQQTGGKDDEKEKD